MKVNYVLMYGTPYLKYREFETFENISKFIVNKNIVDYSIFKKLEDKEEVEMIYRDNDIHYLEKENKQLKEELEYLRSGEYINQLRFERDMLQDLVDKGKISKEDKEFIDCTHRNTELLEELKNKEFLLISQGKELKELYEELEEEKRINVEDLKEIDRQEEIIQDLRADYGNKAQVERDLLKERCELAMEEIDFYIPDNPFLNDDGTFTDGDKELISKIYDILKGENNEN